MNDAGITYGAMAILLGGFRGTMLSTTLREFGSLAFDRKNLIGSNAQEIGQPCKM
jgi:hypothetical protein